MSGLALDGNEIPEGESPTVAACPLSEEDRQVAGCEAKDPKSECTIYEVDVLVPSDVAKVDPDGTGREGEQLTEPVWVDYDADGGDLESSVKLLSDALTGYNDDHKVEWIPPDKPGLYNVWAVVHDARGADWPSCHGRFLVEELGSTWGTECPTERAMGPPTKAGLDLPRGGSTHPLDLGRFGMGFEIRGRTSSVSDDVPEASEVRVTVAARAPHPLTGVRVLVVEDDPDALELLAMSLLDLARRVRKW